MTTTSPEQPAVLLLNISEAAAALNVPEGWLRKKVTERLVPHTRLGKHVRFTEEHLRQIVADGEQAILMTPTVTHGLSRRARTTSHP
ncbi:MAG TPA: helix-turn-helix domain-containing protein [Mycobacteriales bacterium]|jgi:excisionase family DNA binding protein|nr:helix-turn-helix domain-containing protein [Mycobacteriales bacterium]